MSDETKMCEDCKHCIESDEEDGRGICAPPMPWWNAGVIYFVKLKSVAAVACPCFKGNGGKTK